MYCSDSTCNFQHPPLFQDCPKYGDDDHQSWTESIISYRSAARHHAAVLKLNQQCKPRSDYRYWATVSLTQELPAHDVRKQWTKICRMLRNHGIVAGWVAEIDPKTNRVHWHLVVSKWPDFDRTYLILQESGHEHNFKLIADRLKPRFDCSLSESINNYLDYTCKSAGHQHPVLFVTGCGIKKQGTIGNFWVKPKKVYETYLNDKYCHRTREGMKQPGAMELVNLLYDWFGGTVSARTLCHKIGTASTVRWWSDVPRFETYKKWREELCASKFDGQQSCEAK